MELTGLDDCRGCDCNILLVSDTDILGLSEKFLDEISIESIHVKDYHFFHDGRSKQEKPGLGVLIKNCIPVRAKLEISQ